MQHSIASKIYLRSLFLFLLLGSALYAKKYNVILMYGDDIGWGDLASYGHPYSKTPNLDKLAEQGTQFQRFYVTGNWCMPSRVGIATGMNPPSMPNWPDVHGLGWRWEYSVQQLFNNAGYATGNFGKWHISPKEWIADDKMNVPVYNKYGFTEIIQSGGHFESPNGRDSIMYTQAMNFIARNKDKPFYVQVYGMVNHAPIKTAPELQAIFKDLVVDEKIFSPQLQAEFDDIRDLEAKVRQHFPNLGPDIISDAMQKYLGNLYGLDMWIGKLMKFLDDNGLADNTILAYSSDNGPVGVKRGNWEAVPWDTYGLVGYSGGLKGQKHDDYDGGVRTPFIIRLPGVIPAGKVNSTSIISGLDWLPTMCSMAGVPYDPTWYEGEDVSDIFKGGNRSRKNPLFHNHSLPNDPTSILVGKWRLHDHKSGVELYDMTSPDLNWVNVASKHPKVVADLMAKVNEFNASIPKAFCRNNCTALADPKKKPVVIGVPSGYTMNLDTSNIVSTKKPSEQNRLMVGFTKKTGKNSLTITVQNPSGGAAFKSGIVEIFNIKGNLVYKSEKVSLPHTFSISNWVTGDYYSRITQGDQIARRSFRI